MDCEKIGLFKSFIGQSEKIQILKDQAYKVALGNSTVLILGETGTGKGLLARAIHQASKRKKGNFIEVNCGAIPENLIESELFGYTKGSFTGALKEGKKGRFLMADKGSIFLDEIGEMPIHLQVKLLHVLQNRTIEPLGSEKSIPVDLRIIAATNQNLENLIRERKFRKDLYYRLGVIPLHIPPLRKRQEDIPLLATAIFQKCCKALEKTQMVLDDSVIEAFLRYDWPGNVREMENVIEYGINMSLDHRFTAEFLPHDLFQNNTVTTQKECASTLQYKGSYHQQFQHWEEELLNYYLREFGYDGDAKRKIAKELKISIATLYRKLAVYGMDK
ncbi:MAG: sigma 54-interacting transcriptional regulator [Clostridiales bacterium]